MDQESGRRRSSRLAARGTPTKAEIVKKPIKSVEKPKRSKRKTTEEAIELPEAKKTKTEETSDELDSSVENKANDVSGVTPMDEENVETDVTLPPIVEQNVTPAVEEKTDIPDSKEKEDDEINSVAKDENVDKSLTIDEEDKPEEKPTLIKEPEIAEQPKNDVSKEEPVALEDTNGKSDEEKIESAVETEKNDVEFRVANKDITSNGNTNDQLKSNGDKSITEPEAIEPIKVLHDNTNHLTETDIKTVTATSKNDVSNAEQVEKVGDIVTDNTIDDNTSNVDKPSTVLS